IRRRARVTTPARSIAKRKPLVPVSRRAIVHPLPASEPPSSEGLSAFPLGPDEALAPSAPASEPPDEPFGGGAVHVFVAESHTFGAAHSESLAQPRQLFVDVSHTGVAPEQSAFVTHATH